MMQWKKGMNVKTREKCQNNMMNFCFFSLHFYPVLVYHTKIQKKIEKNIYLPYCHVLASDTHTHIYRTFEKNNSTKIEVINKINWNFWGVSALARLSWKKSTQFFTYYHHHCLIPCWVRPASFQASTQTRTEMWLSGSCCEHNLTLIEIELFFFSPFSWWFELTINDTIDGVYIVR